MEQRHLYHLVDPSPWPLVASISAFSLTTGAVMYFHSYAYGGYITIFGFLLILATMFFWWRDVIREATFEGHHTKVVQKGLAIGVGLFIVSEVMFFFAFFWAFFSSSLAPTIDLGSSWPAEGIHPLDPWFAPYANTVILLSSGAAVTWAHNAVITGRRYQTIIALMITIVLAGVFTLLQYMEYLESSFDITDGVYGSSFYLATGFHGLHVIIGTIFLSVCLYRAYKYHYTPTHHLGFEAAAWYCHFVDVVWLFLFLDIYWWGPLNNPLN